MRIQNTYLIIIVGDMGGTTIWKVHKNEDTYVKENRGGVLTFITKEIFDEGRRRFKELHNTFLKENK